MMIASYTVHSCDVIAFLSVRCVSIVVIVGKFNFLFCAYRHDQPNTTNNNY